MPHSAVVSHGLVTEGRTQVEEYAFIIDYELFPSSQQSSGERKPICMIAGPVCGTSKQQPAPKMWSF